MVIVLLGLICVAQYPTPRLPPTCALPPIRVSRLHLVERPPSSHIRTTAQLPEPPHKQMRDSVIDSRVVSGWPRKIAQS